MVQLTNKPYSNSTGFIPSSVSVPLSTLCDPLRPYDKSIFPIETKKLIYKNDCDCVFFYENQLGALQECNHLADLWGIQNSPESLVNPTNFELLLSTQVQK